MFYSIGPMLSRSEPVAAHDNEFKYVPVRRYDDGERFELSAPARQPFDGGLARDGVDTGSLGALTGFAPLPPAEFVIVRLTQHQPADAGDSG